MKNLNRTGTYVAFDGLGQTDPSKSDYRYYATLQAWTRNNNIDFRLVNSHEKTYAVRDSSSKRTLYDRIQERLRASKNMLVVISKDTRRTGSVLSYEIEKAVDFYDLPLIITYPDCSVSDLSDWDKLSNMWPQALADRISGPKIKAIHILFSKAPILDAINRFTVNGTKLLGGKCYYKRESYIQWGIID